MRMNGILDFALGAELTPEGRARQQVKDRGYADKYHGAGEPIHPIGVESSKASRSVLGFELETITN